MGNHNDQGINSTRTANTAEYYTFAYVDGHWCIVRRSNGHVFSVCRSQAEAERITKSLNQAGLLDLHYDDTQDF